MAMKRLASALSWCLLSASASAVTYVPGTQTVYSVSTDPITDVNTSFVILPEINDNTTQTLFSVRCSNYDRQELWASLASKHDLLPQDDADLGLKPAITLRLGNDAPIVLSNSDLSTVVSANEQLKSQSIGFNGAIVRRIVSGLNAGKRLVLRVNRASGGQALTYTFSAEGFSTAWNRVGGCNTSVSAAATPARSVTPVAGASAPKFTQWYFTTCRVASSGAVRTGLVAGTAHLCDLVIETVPNGAQPVAADFHYELEYREGGRTGKLILDGTDTWPSSGGPVVRFRQSGNQLIFTLPLNVRVRPERMYTSINVTGNIVFSNGSNKKVYEPLPVRPSY